MKRIGIIFAMKEELDSLLESFFEGLTKNLIYKRWYCGHYHINENLPKDTTVLYHQIIPLGNLAQF